MLFPRCRVPREQLSRDACACEGILFLAINLEAAQLTSVPGNHTVRYVLDFLVRDE